MSALTLARPLPGLAPLLDYRLSEVDDAPGLYSLESAEHEGVRLHVISAPDYLPGYRPELPLDALVAIGSPEAPTVLIVTTLVDGVPWVNLLAPLVMNPGTGVAIQVILDDGDWPVRVPLAQIVG